MSSHRPPQAPLAHGDSDDNNGQARRLRSLFTPWKGGGGGSARAAAATATVAAATPPPPTPLALRSWHHHQPHPHPHPQTAQLTLTLAQQHALPGGRGRALAFDLTSGGSPALYAGDGPASLKKLSLLSPNAPLNLRLPANSRGARAVAPPAHPGCRHLAGVATAGAGLVMVSGETGNTVVSVPFFGGGGGGSGGGIGSGGPAPNTSASAWSVAWSPLRPTHELLVGLEGGRVATVDLRCASSASQASSSQASSSRAVLSVVRVGGGASSSSISAASTIGPPVHTLAPLPTGCEAALVGGELLACSAAGVFALWRQPGLGQSCPLAAPQLTPPLPRGASCESISVSADGQAVAVSVRRRVEEGGAEVWGFGLGAKGGGEDEDEDDAEPAPAVPLRLGGHASAAHMTAGALLPMGRGQGLVYATGDEARRAPVAWRLLPPSSFSSSPSSSSSPLLPPSLAPASLPAPFPSPVLAVAGARVPGLLGGGGGGGAAGGGASAPLLLAAASAGCVRVYQVGCEED